MIESKVQDLVGMCGVSKPHKNFLPDRNYMYRWTKQWDEISPFNIPLKESIDLAVQYILNGNSDIKLTAEVSTTLKFKLVFK